MCNYPVSNIQYPVSSGNVASMEMLPVANTNVAN